MLARLGQSALTLVLFFILLFVYTKLAGPIPFAINSVSTQKTTTFDVVGQGKATIKPDKATVNVGVHATGQTAKDAQDQLNTTINKVDNAIKALGIDPKNIQTANYNVNPSYDYLSGSQTLKGYTADTNLTITVTQIDLANQVLDTAVTNGATQAGGVSFDNTDTSAAEDQARQLAIADAKKKAQKIAQTVGFNLGPIVNYTENNNQPQPVPFAAGATADSSVAPTKLEPGQNEVTISVTLSYEVR